MNSPRKTFSALKKLLCNFILCLLFSLSCSAGLYQVSWVVDGDTIRLTNGWSIRYLLINTPEIGEPFSEEAFRLNLDLVGGKWVKLEWDIQKTDAYGRYLSYVYQKGKMVNELLVKKGMAHLLIIPPNRKYEEKLLEAQKKAQMEKKGMWSLLEYFTVLHITSFRADPEGDELEDPNREYVRIVNITSQPLSLEGFRVEDAQGNTYTFGSVSLAPGHSVLLRSGIGADQTDPAEQIVIYWNSLEPIWNNEGDTCSIYEPEGKLVTSKTYEPENY